MRRRGAPPSGNLRAETAHILRSTIGARWARRASGTDCCAPTISSPVAPDPSSATGTKAVCAPHGGWALSASSCAASISSNVRLLVLIGRSDSAELGAVSAGGCAAAAALSISCGS